MRNTAPDLGLSGVNKRVHVAVGVVVKLRPQLGGALIRGKGRRHAPKFRPLEDQPEQQDDGDGNTQGPQKNGFHVGLLLSKRSLKRRQ